MSEWKEYKLGDIAEVKGGKRLPKGELLVDYETPHPYIRVTDLGNKWVRKTGLQFVTPEIQKLISRYIVNSGDVILSIVGSIGFVGRVSQELNGANLTENCVKFLTDNNIIYNDFLFYYLKSNIGQEEIEKRNVGSTQPKLPLYNIKDIDILLPPLPEQTVIASVLSSLDDKIDLLQRQNATLEKMAETLFRQWFVEEAKEEWEVGTLDDILTVKGGTTPSTSESKYWNGTIHWTSPRDITNLNGIYLFDTERKITELGLSKISSGLLPKGTLLMSSRAPVGVLAFSEVPVAINQGYIAILDNKGYSKEFIYLWLKTNIEVVHSFSNGSTFMEISKSAFKTLEIQIPPKQSLGDFQIVIKPLFEKIKSNQTQIRTLSTLRDTLLPKLMSGEVIVELEL